MEIQISCDCGRFGDISSAAAAEKQIDWWNDSNPDTYTCICCHAAVELKEHLEKAGCSVSFDDSSGNSNVRIYIGKAPGPWETGTDGSFFCVENNDGFSIFLWGNDGKSVLHATYEWLESLGFRWYLPDEKGDIIPDEIHLSKGGVNIEYDYRTRACYNGFIDDTHTGFLLWASRNRMNMLRVKRYTNPHYVKKLGLDIMGGGHEIFYRYLNPNKKTEDGRDTYFDRHPEWFALVDGVRSKRDENVQADEGYYTGDNICTSDAGAVSELAKNMIESFNGGDYMNIDYLNLWAYDNGRWCQCGNCLKTGNLSRRMLMLAYEINKIFRKAYENGNLKRRIKLVVPVYHETLEPPDKPLPKDFDYEYITATFFPIERCYLHDIDDEECKESNALLMKDYRGWISSEGSNYKGELFIGEYYNVSSFASLPFIFTRTMANDIPFYHKTGTRHLYFMHISARKWGMLALNNNLLATLMRNINTEPMAFFREFYHSMYPMSGEIMSGFHKRLEQASANAKYLKHYQFSPDGRKLSLMGQITEDDMFPLLHCKFDYRDESVQSGPSFEETMNLFEEAGEILENAINVVSGDELERIRDEKMRYNYGYYVMKFIYFYALLRREYGNGNLSEAEKAFDMTEGIKSKLVEIKEPISEFRYESSRYENAYLATWHADGYEKFRRKLIKNHKWHSEK